MHSNNTNSDIAAHAASLENIAKQKLRSLTTEDKIELWLKSLPPSTVAALYPSTTTKLQPRTLFRKDISITEIAVDAPDAVDLTAAKYAVMRALFSTERNEPLEKADIVIEAWGTNKDAVRMEALVTKLRFDLAEQAMKDSTAPELKIKSDLVQAVVTVQEKLFKPSVSDQSETPTL